MENGTNVKNGNIYSTICDNGVAINEIGMLTDALAKQIFYAATEPQKCEAATPRDFAPTIKEMVQAQQKELQTLISKMRDILSEVSN